MKKTYPVAFKPSLNKRLSCSDPNLGKGSMLEMSSASEDSIGKTSALRSVTSISKYLSLLVLQLAFQQRKKNHVGRF